MAHFKEVIEDFSATMDALRDFVSNIGPVLVQRQEDAVRTATSTLAQSAIAFFLTDPTSAHPLISAEGQAALVEIREFLTGADASAQPEKVTQVKKMVQALAPVKVEAGKIEYDLDDRRAVDALAHHRTIERMNQEVRLLYEGSIMTLVSAAEWFIAQLIALFFRKYPDSADSSEPFFSLSSLIALQTLEDAREALIEHRVETLMRKSFEDWLQFFKDRPKLGMGYLSNVDERASISEVFKRRNLIVHNGGRISRRYLNEVNDSLSAGLKTGDMIDLTPEYLNESIGLIEHQFVLIAVELWKKLEPADSDRGSLLLRLGVQHLTEKRWKTARGFSYFAMNDNNSEEAARLSARVNYWQSFKWSGEFATVKDEVDKFDCSAKRPLFQLAHAVIRDDFGKVFEMLPSVLASGELKKVELATWPLFAEVRQRPEFATYRGTEEPALETKDEGEKPELPSDQMIN